MAVSNRLPSIATCPPKLEGWKPLADFPLAKLSDLHAPEIVAKGLPQGSFCQRVESGATSYFVQEARSAFVDLLLMPHKQGILETPPVSDDELSAAIALITARRHPSTEESQKLAVFEKAPPLVDTSDAGIDWIVVDADLNQSLVTLLRFELDDHDNALFRLARHGDAFYVTADTENLSHIISILQEVKRDLTVVGQHDAAESVNMAATQLAFIQTHVQGTQPFWKKPFRELWPMGATALIAGATIAWQFAEAPGWVGHRQRLFATIAEWIRNHRNPPSAGAGGTGGGSGVVNTNGDANGVQFSTIDDHVDAGEQADFQIDPRRAYDPLHHYHINGAMVAVGVALGAVALVLPEILPVMAEAAPEWAPLAAGTAALAH